MELVTVDVAARVTGYDPKTLRRLYETGKIMGEASDGVSSKGRRCRRVFLNVQSILGYKSRRWKKRIRAPRAYRAGSRELVCLSCVVPGGCHEWDLRCKYRKLCKGGN